MFVGEIKPRKAKYGYVCVLTMLPLRLQKDRFVFTLTVNGEDGFKGKVGDLNDFDKWWSELPQNAE